EAYDGDIQMIRWPASECSHSLRGDSSSIRVHQHGANGPKKGGRSALGENGPLDRFLVPPAMGRFSADCCAIACQPMARAVG
ncbi:MAG: hypothetical protein AAGK57_14265, partial [Pseudomonadota bacterium]